MLFGLGDSAPALPYCLPTSAMTIAAPAFPGDGTMGCNAVLVAPALCGAFLAPTPAAFL
ncbi:hypothetical protein GCM10018980_13790 [Streptomyces capoamus]|uniref:Uncharacterized protein n=1 Tax=Streptomyces capoamus TaxID=68183 RepID=A0A919C3Y6_9ACTN|nr:hypothetical protein GCM10010501_20690 [Streptomyces libani subsp. rufus]GHG39932.1 hypothetical protein GCM10018980_13790 [Streptomyces capoamus]